MTSPLFSDAALPTSPDWVRRCSDAWLRVKHQRPLIHVITNAVAAERTANTLLAVGAIPAMSLDADEIAESLQRAQALTVNLGTLDPLRRAAVLRATTLAYQNRCPWVLDPVMVDGYPSRRALAQGLLFQKPLVVRGNGREMQALSLSPHTTVVAQTGQIDVIAYEQRQVHIGNGHGWLAQLTAAGCALSALVATLIAVEPDPLLATSAALLGYGIASELAAADSRGLGDFGWRLINALHDLDEFAFNDHARLVLKAIA